MFDGPHARDISGIGPTGAQQRQLQVPQANDVDHDLQSQVVPCEWAQGPSAVGQAPRSAPLESRRHLAPGTIHGVAAEPPDPPDLLAMWHEPLDHPGHVTPRCFPHTLARHTCGGAKALRPMAGLKTYMSCTWGHELSEAPSPHPRDSLGGRCSSFHPRPPRARAARRPMLEPSMTTSKRWGAWAKTFRHFFM